MKNFELLPETFGDANPGFASATSDSADNSTTCDTAANSGYSRIKQLKKDLQAKQILEPFQARLERFAEEVAEAFENSGIDDEIAQFRADVLEAVEQLEIELPDRPEPEYAGDGDGDWLYDSRRDYSTQLSFYKARRHGDVEEALL